MEQKGRPPVIIDWEQVAFRLQSGTSGAALANILGINPSTLYNRCVEDNGMTFTEYQQKCRSEGVENIRLKQYEVAMQGDKSMLIFLGKNYLGQRDRVDVTTNDAPIKPDKIEIVMPARMLEIQKQNEDREKSNDVGYSSLD